MRYFINCFLAIILAGSMHAQIKGRVIELLKNGDTTFIPGVVMFWENTPIGVSTDADGRFELKTSPTTNKLLINAVGYKNDTLVIKDTTQFLILKLRSGINLNEVEVIYYSSGTEISYLSAIKTELITERSLMKAACCNLSESFETNPSIDVNYSDAISGTRQIQMLGLSGQYAQITKENMPYMRGLAGNYGLSFIPGTWIQSIQLSKGAGSVVNGYESFTGQINTELQDPNTSDKVHFNMYANQNARNEYNLNLAHRINEKFAVGLLNHVSFNPLQEDKNKDGFADIPTGRQYNFMNKYSYQSNKGFEAQFGGGYLDDDRSGGQINNLSSVKNDSVYRIGIQNKKWELYSKTGYVFRKLPGTSMGLQLSYLNHDQHNFFGTTNYTGLQKTFYANYIFQGIINNTNNTYKIGASYLDDNVAEGYAALNYTRHEKVAGVFTEFAKNYKDKFNMVAGLRADYHNYYGLFFTPRLHLRYAFTPNTILRFSGGKALRTSNIFSDNAHLMASSRNWVITSSDLSLPYALRPEIGWNYGLNFTQRFKINYREAYITLDVYRTDFTDQTVVDLDYNTQQVNIYNLNGVSFSNTFQFEFNMEPRKRLFLKTAYRFVDTQTSYKTGLMQKPMVSAHRAFINIAYETKDNHWQFDVTGQYNGSKRLPTTNSNPDVYKRAEYSKDFYNVLSQITYITKIKKADFNMYLGVENLLNYKQTNPIVASDVPYSKYFDASMVWGPIYGRMLYLGLRYKIK